MAFPATPLGLTTELHLGPALGWVDVTPDVRVGSASSGGGVSISRGRPNEGSEVEVARCGLVLNHRGGKYSGRNPASPYYGLLGRNTPIRVRVAEAGPGGALAVDGRRGAGAAAQGAAVTGPHASLNGTGDLDVRVWLRLPQWTDHTRAFIAGKDDAWAFAIGDAGNLEFYWVNGSSVLTGSNSGQFRPAPLPDGSLALRVTLTVATGVRTFYTAPTIAGPWTQLSQGTFGATSVKAGPYGVEVGRVSSFGAWGMNGELYGFELRHSGILVASPDFTALRAGDTQLVDAQGRTWTWSGGAIPIDRGARFHGEVSAWPPRWDISGKDRWVPVEAAGVTRRMSQGNSPVISPLRRTLTAANPAAYLPLEDGENATRPTSAAAGIGAGSSNKVTFGVTSGRLGGTVAAAQMTDFTSFISTPVVARPGSSAWSLMLFLKLPAQPSGGDVTYLRLYTSGGTVARWELQASSGGFRFVGYSRTGAVVDDEGILNGGVLLTSWMLMYVEFSQVGGNVSWRPYWTNAGNSFYATPGSAFTYAGAFGYPTKVEVVGSAYLQDGLVSHLAVADQRLFLADNLAQVSTGYAGETAGNRIIRLAAEEGVPVTVWGYPHDTEVMGPQPIAPLLDVLRDAAKADGGILTDARSHLGLTYRTRASLYNRPAVPLDYAAGHISPPFDPVDDDDATRNDITVSRPDGGSARAVQTTGPLSTANPPAGVGTYDTSDTVNVATDDQLPDQAGWRLWLGTVDEARYPRIRVDLAARALASDPALTQAVARVDAGDALSPANLPPWLPPGPVKVMVQGYAEHLDVYDWTITYNASPGSPWDVAVVDGAARVPADGSTTLGLAAGNLSMLLASTDENGPWTEDAADFPLSLRVGAEQVAASAIGPALADTFTRTVSNGWGTAGTGQPWTVSGGATSDYSTSGTAGRISNGTVNVLRYALADLATTDPTLLLEITNPLAAPTGAPVTHWVLFRAADTNNYYCARLDIKVGGGVDLVLLKRVGGALSGSLASAAGIGTHAAGATWRVAVFARGSLLRAKAWRTAVPEPGWQVEATDGDLTSGTLGGVATRLESGNTSTLPVVVSVDNVRLISPQLVTLSARGVNGVTRTWPAGTDVDVWQPAVLSL
ncbi:hypothetical protein O7622_01260 [Micromonospora sp. WMMD1076]|uniref:hypothetical protein n=1 Tax=Micromonospora sp. WMMD1076 TaxID=3016103 RepID=UPI00249C1769|nr:hypothetical protein [Micromonospora sp. WMMD1076]WFF07259.1 hypothetical protein O7622_01260 [Micromonospora sp. WMMD1076]